MPNEENEMLIYWDGLKLLKVQFVIYIDFEIILEKASIYDNNPEASYTIEISKHTVWSFAIFVK